MASATAPAVAESGIEGGSGRVVLWVIGFGLIVFVGLGFLIGNRRKTRQP